MSWDCFLDMATPREAVEMLLYNTMGSAQFDSLWRSDSGLLAELLEPQRLGDSSFAFFRDSGWLGSRSGLSAAIREYINRYGSGDGIDSLFAISEMARRMLIKRVFEECANGLCGVPQSILEWESMLDSIAKMFAALSDKSQQYSGDSESRRNLLNSLGTDPELLSLWKEAMLRSLNRIALEKVSNALCSAMCSALHRCGGSKTVQAPFGDRSELGYGIAGDNPFVAGGGMMFYDKLIATPPESFEEFLVSMMALEIGSMGLGSMTALFSPDNIADLVKKVRGTLFERVGSDSAAREWAAGIDLESVVSRALKQAAASKSRAGAMADEFINTIGESLGDDISGWLGHGPSPAQIFENPHYFDDWARSYLTLINSMAINPSVIMPNIEKFAEAARRMRNRHFPETDRILVGRGDAATNAESLAYFIPAAVFLKDPAKKKTSAGLAPSLVPPPAPVHAWGGARRRELPVIIDGDLSEWKQSYPYRLCGKPVGDIPLPPELRNEGCLMTQWDNRGLYVAYSIFDLRDNGTAIATFWDCDALELFFDPNNFKDSRRIEGRSWQFWIWPRAASARGAAGVSRFIDYPYFVPTPLRKGAIRFASVHSDNRYTCEAFIPARLIERWHPLPGKVIGFNFSINNGEGFFFRWVTNLGDNISIHPNLWGDLLLMGTDASLSLGPDPFLLPGANLTVTVIDQDMNLSAFAPDKIWVRAFSRLTRDRIPFCIVETGDDTGVFTGSIGTLFAFAPKFSDRISTRPGDVIEIYYLDQQCSDGKKGTPLTARISVVRGAMEFTGAD